MKNSGSVNGPSALGVAVVFLVLTTQGGSAQEATGRVIDGSTGTAIPGAVLLVLDSARTRVEATLVDSAGRYVVEFPSAGRHYLAAEAFGYTTAVSPPIDLPAGTRFELDLELLPDPIALAPIEVSVRNEELEQWVTLRGHEANPAARMGYRSIQGRRIVEARAKAQDNTDFLRWLYVPISHGRTVCIKVRNECADLYLDDRKVPAELIETFDLSTVVAVLAVPYDFRPNEFHFFTAGFDFSVNPGR